MLPFRLGIVTGVAALCLWGLFSLLDSLQEPGLLRTAKVTVVKGCDEIDSTEAQQQCPVLFCQKAVLDAKLVPLQARFDVSFDRTYDNNERLLAGSARNTAGDVPVFFRCDLSGVKVTAVKSMERAAFEELTDAGP